MRMLSWQRMAFAAAVAAGLPAALWVVGAKACGPDFEPEVFVPAHRPEAPARYAAGQLGVVRGGFYHADLVVAYRYLSGGPLTAAEQAAYVSGAGLGNDEASYSAWDARREAGQTAALEAWRVARAAVAPGAAPPAVGEDRTIQQTVGTYTFKGEELNCTDGAYVTAAKTLGARAAAWGAGSSEVKEWLRGQDAVFSNCTGAGTAPEAARPEWAALLRRDRAYQMAAAAFYAGRFDEAIAGFAGVGGDLASPWSRWGEYLAARAEVRKASQSGKAGEMGEKANFDEGLLRAAESRLVKVLGATKDAEVRHAAQAELNFIEVRLEPEKRLDAAGVALAAAGGDPDFGQDLADLDWLIGGRGGSSELVRWIEAMRGTPSAGGALSPSAGTERWMQRPTLPWLVAGLTWGTPSEEMLRAAAEVAPGSAGYQTVSFYRAQGMIAAGRGAEARPLLTGILGGLTGEGSVSTRNLFLSERIETARTLGEFLADAPRTVVWSGSASAELAKCSQGAVGKTGECTGKLPEMEFDADAAGDMNRQMPLAMLEEAAGSGALPLHLRTAVAEVAWVRALGLGDGAGVARMSQLLPDRVRAAAGESGGFPATLALLRNPGLKPYLEAGVQRSASFGQMDHFGDNWWCGRWTDGETTTEGGGVTPVAAGRPLGFLSAEQRRVSAEEATRLDGLPSGLVWTARRAIAWVKAHPEDKEGAETLALVVQGTHWGCDRTYGPKDAVSPQRAVSKEAFTMLHRMYPTSEWALKTKYYY